MKRCHEAIKIRKDIADKGKSKEQKEKEQEEDVEKWHNEDETSGTSNVWLILYRFSMASLLPCWVMCVDSYSKGQQSFALYLRAVFSINPNQ